VELSALTTVLIDQPPKGGVHIIDNQTFRCLALQRKCNSTVVDSKNELGFPVAERFSNADFGKTNLERLPSATFATHQWRFDFFGLGSMTVTFFGNRVHTSTCRRRLTFV
jgi:hypothetical protein